jgi:hypothetical protein
MVPFVLLHLLSAVPTVSLSADSSCAPREVLRQDLGSIFADGGAVVLRLEQDGKLTLVRDGKVVLTRALGSGTCAELGRAAAVVVARWIQELSQPTVPLKIEVKPPRTPNIPTATTTPTIDPVPVRAQQERVGEANETPPIKVVEAPSPEVIPRPHSGESDADAGEVVTGLPTGGSEADAGAVVTGLATGGSEVDAGAVAPQPRAPSAPPVFLEALGGGGLTAPGTAELAPAISLDLAMLYAERLRVNLAGFFDFGGSVRVRDEAGLTRGELTTRGGAVLPGAAWCLTSPFRACFGATAGIRIVEGESSGAFVFDRKTRRVARFVFGPNVQLALIRGPFFLALDLSLLGTPAPQTFEVQGLPTKLTLPSVQGLFRLSVGFGSSL